MKLAALLLLVACGGYVIPDLNPPPGKDVKQIRRAGALMRSDWEQTPWHRPGDLPLGMVFFVVAQDGSACIVPDDLWAVAKERDTVRCSPWRIAR